MRPATAAWLRWRKPCAQRCTVRPTDVPARYGGEQFAVLLPTTDRAGAARVADCLRCGVAEIDFSHEGKSIPLTCSVGVQTVSPAPGANAATAMQEADAALYVAKREGRNRVAVVAAHDRGALGGFAAMN